MTTEITVKNEELSLAIRSYLRTGDLSVLPDVEKDKVLLKMCEHYQLDAVMRPFILIKLNGKEVWYPTKSATDMVAAKFNLTREVLEIKENVERGILECRVKVTQEGSSRTETCISAVSIVEFGRDETGKIVGKIMKGEAYANALMKVDTKAKRRATLGWLGIADYYDPAENERDIVEIRATEARQILEMDEKESENKEGKKRGRPSRADIEARAMAEKPTEENRLHLAEQLSSLDNLGEEKEKKHYETQPRVNGKFAPKEKPVLEELQDIPDTQVAPQVENKIKIVSENEVTLENIDLIKKEPEVTQVPCEEVDEKNDFSIDNFIKYNRDNDNHRHMMKLTLDTFGIDWKKAEQVKIASAVSLALNNVAPCFDSDGQFAKAEFSKAVKHELDKQRKLADESNCL